MKESAVLLGPSRTLVGVVTEPAEVRRGSELPAFLFLNSGLVHRVGPKRLTVRLARRVAELGHTSIRIDFSGIGDSRAAGAELPLPDRWIAEGREAIRHLRETRGIERFVVAGNCSGATYSFLIAQADPDVVGAVLVNPQSPATLRYQLRLMTRHPAFWRRLLRAEFWAKRFQDAGSRVARSRAGGRKVTVADVLQGLESLIMRDVRLLIASCEWDAGYDLYQRTLRDQLLALGGGGRVELEAIPGSDHDFNLVAAQERLIEAVAAWALRSRAEPASHGAAVR